MRTIFAFLVSVLILCNFACSGAGGGGGAGDDGGETESVPLEIQSIVFGNLAVGEASNRQLVIRNPADGQEAIVVEFNLPVTAGFTLPNGGPNLPFAIPPGSSRRIPIDFNPGAVGNFAVSGEIALDRRPSQNFDLSGSAFQPEEVVDFGTVALDSEGKTPVLEVDIPANAISFTIEAEATGAAANGFFPCLLEGPGKVYVDEQNPHQGPYVFGQNFPFLTLASVPLPSTIPTQIGRFQVPNSDAAEVQLVPTGGIYRFKIAKESGPATQFRIRVIIERRSSSVVNLGRLPLNVFFAPGLGINPSTAASDPRVQTPLAAAELILKKVGLGFGRVSYFGLTDPAFNFPQDLAALYRQSALAPAERLNLFLVVNAGPVGGSAGAIPGGKRNGHDTSGVHVNFTFGPSNIVGRTIAHEICHFLGLHHPIELPGGDWPFDLIQDTVETAPPNYLMLPNVPGDILTIGQAHVILRNPLVEAGPPTFIPGPVFQGSAQLPAPEASGPKHACAICGR